MSNPHSLPSTLRAFHGVAGQQLEQPLPNVPRVITSRAQLSGLLHRFANLSNRHLKDRTIEEIINSVPQPLLQYIADLGMVLEDAGATNDDRLFHNDLNINYSGRGLVKRVHLPWLVAARAAALSLDPNSELYMTRHTSRRVEELPYEEVPPGLTANNAIAVDDEEDEVTILNYTNTGHMHSNTEELAFVLQGASGQRIVSIPEGGVEETKGEEYKDESTECPGCAQGEYNQEAHMIPPYGCLYEPWTPVPLSTYNSPNPSPSNSPPPSPTKRTRFL